MKVLFNFTELKNILSIFILLFGLTFTSFAQNKTALPGDGSSKLIKVYPIPATTAVNFEFQRGYDKTISFLIYNFMGKKVLELKNPSSKINLPLTDFFRGLYIYQVRDKNGKIIESGRFQVVK